MIHKNTKGKVVDYPKLVSDYMNNCFIRVGQNLVLVFLPTNRAWILHLSANIFTYFQQMRRHLQYTSKSTVLVIRHSLQNSRKLMLQTQSVSTCLHTGNIFTLLVVNFLRCLSPCPKRETLFLRNFSITLNPSNQLFSSSKKRYFWIDCLFWL